MKKLFALFLAVLMVGTLVACSGKGDSKPENDSTAGQTETKPDTESPDTETPNTEETPSVDGTTPVPDGSVTQPNANVGDSTVTPQTPPASTKPNTTPTTKPNTNTSKPNTNTTTKPTTPPAGNNTTTTPPAGNGSTATESKGDLLSLMATLLKGTESDMMVSTEEISADAYQYNLFIDYVDGYKAVSSAPMMGSIAHSVCLLQVPNGTDVAAVAAQIDKNKDPRKWICVEAEKSVVLHKGNYILLVMSETATADQIVQNFNANF